MPSNKAADMDSVWEFDFYAGYQGWGGKTHWQTAIALRPDNVSVIGVPETRDNASLWQRLCGAAHGEEDIQVVG